MYWGDALFDQRCTLTRHDGRDRGPGHPQATDKPASQDLDFRRHHRGHTPGIRRPKVTDSTKIKAEIDKAVRQYEQNANKRELTPELQKMKLDAIPFNVKYKLANEYSMSSREVVKYDGERFYWEITVNSRSDSIKPDATLAEQRHDR